MAKLNEQLEDMISGKFKTEDMPWKQLTHLSRAIVPGSIALLCGSPGASKTFMILQALSFWHEMKIPTVFYGLEEYTEFYLFRILSQITGVAGITDDEWVRGNPEDAREIIARNQEYLDTLSLKLHCSPKDLPTLSDLSDWIEDQAQKGMRIICIDPITIAARGMGEAYVNEEMFIKSVSRTCSKHKCTVVLVSHPVKGKVARPDVSLLAGSSAFSRFTAVVMWLQFHDEKASDIRTSVGTDTITHNRTVHILKARNGKGQGCRIAFNFNAESLTLDEVGLIIKKGKK